MANLFSSPKPPSPPPAPSISAAQADAQASQAAMLRAGAVGQQQTVLTQGLTNPTVRKGATLLGGTS